MRQKVAKRIRQEHAGEDIGVIRNAKREYNRKRQRQFPKLKISKRQARLSAKEKNIS